MSLPNVPTVRSAAPGWLPCSDRSLERGDPLLGTAGYGERWFLVEIDGAWGAHAFLQSPLDPALARALVTRIESAGIRPLAIRRTGRTSLQRNARPSGGGRPWTPGSATKRCTGEWCPTPPS